MKNSKKTGLHWFHILAFMVAVNCVSVSCTFDYFVDETNYRVYVPEVEANTVDNCVVLIYEAEGSQKLVFRKEAQSPFNTDEKIKSGLFSFKLFPGKYNVRVLANTSGSEILGQNEPDTRVATLHSTKGGDSYGEPSLLMYDFILGTEIDYPAPIKTDIAELKHATGTIEVCFKNFPYNESPVSVAGIKIANVGIYIPFLPTFTVGRFTASDCQYSEHTSIPSASEFVLSNHYLPSITGETMYAEITLIGRQTSFQTINVPLTDDLTETGIPLILNPRDVIRITIDQWLPVGIELIGWDEDIKPGTDIEGI